MVVAILGGLIFIMPKPPTEQSLNFPEIETQLQNGSRLVDVRTAEEYAENHIVGAINIPLASIESGDLSALDKSVKNYVYCHSGNRATQAADVLHKAGYDIENLGAMSHVVSVGGTTCDTNC